ncbi:hypothetical protein IRZ71_20380 [Flavobacterium sp. ANB]|uniref:hypothetical protein n=1 Tax=unclassified Flavobacterium TaxID=196869 RepID=UPI0012B8BD97|nr:MULTISPECIES: hypothetical protein [unclassified Flavobacterium]MBF4518720.1 hypothetical protein [Flavobacterium sp. ANB]MTD67748.1 hypothetical protein [Flavobacterium sp. LC2016-13]
MSDNQKHWSSKMLVLFGTWLWKHEEYGHALLCIHGAQWGLKIGTLLSITWDDVVHYEDGMAKHELWLYKKDESVQRPINVEMNQLFEKAYAQLPIENFEDSVYMNYKTGKPLTSSTLNRELQRLSERFLAEIKEKTSFDFNFKPLKTNAFEIAWALDMVKKYHYSKQVFSALSSHMGHRTIGDTIKLLEVEPTDKIKFDFDNMRDLGKMLEGNLFDDADTLAKFIHYDVFFEGEQWAPVLLKKIK